MLKSSPNEKMEFSTVSFTADLPPVRTESDVTGDILEYVTFEGETLRYNRSSTTKVIFTHFLPDKAYSAAVHQGRSQSIFLSNSSADKEQNKLS